MRVAVFVNPRAGWRRRNDAITTEIRALFASEGMDARVEHVLQRDLVERARAALAEPLHGMVAAGGDGTISTLAGICVETNLPLGVLPMGTHNHFAKDLAIPLRLADAVRVIAQNKVRSVDVGEVNGRIFINNSSIGAYPRAVQKREELRRTYGLRKMTAMVIAVLKVFARERPLRVRIEFEGRKLHQNTPFVFVGNNDYDEVNIAGKNFRSRLDAGVLCICAARGEGVAAFLRLFWRAVRGRLDESENFQKEIVERATFHLSKTSVRVAVDGEVFRMCPPLHYLNRPRALRVFVP